MKILIVKMSSLGDIVHAFPALQYLRSKFPQAQIDWAVEKPFAELIEAHPAVNRVISADTKKWRKHLFHCRKSLFDFIKQLREVKYDILFDLQGNTKSALLTGLAHSMVKVGFGKKTVSEWPNLLFTKKRYNPPFGRNIREDYLFLVQSYFNDEKPFIPEKVILKAPFQVDLPLCSGLKVMVCPGSAWPNKRVNPQALIDFLEKLQKQSSCTFFFIWGNSEEKRMAEDLKNRFQSHVLEKVPLPVLQNVMEKMDLVIAMDSFPLHLAGTTSSMTFSIFGASSALKYKPLGTSHEFLQGVCPYGRLFEKRCPILRTCKTGSCIRDLSGDFLYEGISKKVMHKL